METITPNFKKTQTIAADIYEQMVNAPCISIQTIDGQVRVGIAVVCNGLNTNDNGKRIVLNQPQNIDNTFKLFHKDAIPFSLINAKKIVAYTLHDSLISDDEAAALYAPIAPKTATIKSRWSLDKTHGWLVAVTGTKETMTGATVTVKNKKGEKTEVVLGELLYVNQYGFFYAKEVK